MLAAPATINFCVTQMVVQKLCGLLHIRTCFLSMYMYIHVCIIHGLVQAVAIQNNTECVGVDLTTRNGSFKNSFIHGKLPLPTHAAWDVVGFLS